MAQERLFVGSSIVWRFWVLFECGLMTLGCCVGVVWAPFGCCLGRRLCDTFGCCLSVGWML
eukprot:5026067-Lingulodinium_polyedra.AAC.1